MAIMKSYSEEELRHYEKFNHPYIPSKEDLEKAKDLLIMAPFNNFICIKRPPELSEDQKNIKDSK